MSANQCTHTDSIEQVEPSSTAGCTECMRTGDRWVHLRLCLSCGEVACCDSSPNRHATKHARASTHPVIASAEAGERWLYCYPDDAFAEY